MTLRRCVKKQEGQLLLVWFFELSARDLVAYSKPCPGQYSLIVWNIFMKLYRCMHDIETMCHEQGRQLLLVWVFELSALD